MSLLARQVQGSDAPFGPLACLTSVLSSLGTHSTHLGDATKGEAEVRLTGRLPSEDGRLAPLPAVFHWIGSIERAPKHCLHG